jgi:hypothetical protein
MARRLLQVSPPFRGGFLAHDPVRPLPCLALRGLDLQSKLLADVPADEPAGIQFSMTWMKSAP